MFKKYLVLEKKSLFVIMCNQYLVNKVSETVLTIYIIESIDLGENIQQHVEISVTSSRRF